MIAPITPGVLIALVVFVVTTLGLIMERRNQPAGVPRLPRYLWWMEVGLAIVLSSVVGHVCQSIIDMGTPLSPS